MSGCEWGAGGQGVADSLCKPWKRAGAEGFGDLQGLFLRSEGCWLPRRARVWEGPCCGNRGGESKGQEESQGSATTWLCDLRQFSALSGPVSICKMDMVLSLEVIMGG